MLNLIQNQYAMSFNHCKSYRNYRDSYVVYTEEGEQFLVKRLDLQPGRLLFVHEITQWLLQQGMQGTEYYIPTNTGALSFQKGEASYVLMRLEEGDMCNFDDASHLTESCKMLGKIHQASKGYFPSEQCTPRVELDKIPGIYKKRLDELKKLKRAASRGRTQFDYLFMTKINAYIHVAKEAVEALEQSQYDQIVKTYRETGGFCHHDFTYHNIVFRQAGIYVKNFEFASLELKEYDVANVIRRKMRKCNWDIGECYNMLDAYTAFCSISAEEFAVLKIMLQFPQKFWRIANKYYNSRKNAFEKHFVQSLKEVIAELEDHQKLIAALEMF